MVQNHVMFETTTQNCDQTPPPNASCHTAVLMVLSLDLIFLEEFLSNCVLISNGVQISTTDVLREHEIYTVEHNIWVAY